MNDIEKHVCNHYEVTLEEIKADLRNRKYSVPRQIIYYFSSKHFNISNGIIARKYNKKHSDVKFGISRVISMMESDMWYWLTIQELKFKINPGISIKELGKVKEL